MSTKISLLFLTALLLLTASASSSGPVSSPAPSPESYFPPSPTGEESGSPAPIPEVDPCIASLFSMFDCLSYVVNGSKLKKPEKKCCPELADVAANNTICLCKLFGNTTDTLGITVDISRATKLPSLCNVSTPDPSLCSLLSGQPSPSPGGQPPVGATGEGGLAAASPTAGNGNSGAIRAASCSASASLVGFAAITFVSMFFRS